MNLFGIESRTTIETAPFMKTNDHDAFHYCLDNYKYVTCAEVRGYMNDNLSTLHQYDGRYGKGVVRTTSCFYHGKRSKNYMTIEYWVKEK
jgi:hypothetical protein